MIIFSIFVLLNLLKIPFIDIYSATSDPSKYHRLITFFISRVLITTMQFYPLLSHNIWKLISQFLFLFCNLVAESCWSVPYCGSCW